MKISITMTIDVDAQEWCDEYGYELSEARESIKYYAVNAVQGCLSIGDENVTVALKQ